MKPHKNTLPPGQFRSGSKRAAAANPQSAICNLQFGDADFFRLNVREYASSLPPVPNIEFLNAELQTLSEILTRECRTDVHRTDLLIQIAALCERAAVDLTIPASRISNSRDRARPARASARSASKKGKAL